MIIRLTYALASYTLYTLFYCLFIISNLTFFVYTAENSSTIIVSCAFLCYTNTYYFLICEGGKEDVFR